MNFKVKIEFNENLSSISETISTINWFVAHHNINAKNLYHGTRLATALYPDMNKYDLALMVAKFANAGLVGESLFNHLKKVKETKN